MPGDISKPPRQIHAPTSPFALEGADATRLLAAIVESSDDAIVSKSVTGIIQSWNAAAGRVFGYTAEEAVGRHISLIIPPERLHEEDEIMARLLAGERIDHFETERRRSDGTLVAVSLTISPIRDDAGRVVGASKIVRDISVQREFAERELRLRAEADANDAKFRAFFEQGALFAGIMDLDGTIVEANRLSWEGCGYTKDQVIGCRFCHGPWWSPSPDLMRRVREATTRARQGETVRQEMPYYVGDGSRRMVDLTILPIRDEAGRVVLLAPTGTDITDRKAAEATLLALSRELADISSRKDEFLATLSHELRNPLAGVRNSLAVLQAPHADASAAQRARGAMERQIAHMARLLDDLLDVSRITRDRLELRPERVELGAVLDGALEVARPTFIGAGLDLVESRPARQVWLHADAARLTQVFDNLLTNAAKFTPPGGRVWLTVEPDAAGVAISVRDTGIGIPASQLGRVFELFSQVDDSADAARGGLGIGLSLVKRLVEMHGGTVTARSEGRGTGAEFVVRLPTLLEELAGPARAEPIQSAQAQPQRVLVVDDDHDSADCLALLLQAAGHTVAVARDGQAALERAEVFAPDVMLLDIGLPRLDGYEVCRRLRAQPWGRQMHVVALTGWGQEDDRRRTREAGFDRHLVKPVDPTALLRALATPGGITGAAAVRPER